MVISKLHLDKITNHLGLIQGYIEKLRTIKKLSIEDFLSDNKNVAATESYLRRSLECIFDVGRHITAKIHGSKDLEYKNIAKKLGENGVISDEYSKTLIEMAGYRNRMVHLYSEISDKEMYNILHNHLSDLERFINEITDFILQYKMEIKDNANK